MKRIQLIDFLRGISIFTIVLMHLCQGYTIVGILGYEEMRPWGSFFLQYLWEFCLGMWIAEKMVKGHTDVTDDTEKTGRFALTPDFIHQTKVWWLLAGAIGGMGLSATMAWNGGWLKLYNDIPSLIGYLSVMLLIYKIGVKSVNNFFAWASGFSYELYLIHSLVFVLMAFVLKELPLYVLLAISLLMAYAAGYSYSWLLMKTKLK